MATHFNILAWRIPLTEEPGGLQFLGSQESDMTKQLNDYRCVPGTFQCGPHVSIISCNAPSKPMKYEICTKKYEISTIMLILE